MDRHCRPKEDRGEEPPCEHLSNSKLQTRCSGATGRIIRLEARDEELFLTSRVHRSMLFSFNLLTTAISSQLQCGLTIRIFHSYFLRLVVSHALLSTDARFFLFPAILVAQVLVGAMGNTPPIWMWCWGHFCCYSLLMDFVHLRVGSCPGFCTSTHGTHSFRFALSLRRCLSTSIFNFLLRDVHFYF